MNVNPEDYDPEELRRMAAEPRDSDRPDGRAEQRNGSETPEAPHARRNGERDDVTAPRFAGGPRQYDEPSHRRRGNAAPGRGVAADALRSNQLEQLFLHQSAMVTEEMTKPYLAGLPQKYAAERVIFDWLEFLVLKGGFKRTMDALRYYRTIEWITPEVEDALQDYLVGFTEDGQGSHDLDVDDHQLSLLYVARLASMS
jgi:archaellum component FlaD/FlaE